MKWWEKTVEYSFVYKAAREKVFNLFLPLDGEVESIGDTVICKDSQFFIIEFKKTLTDLSGEYKKYIGGFEGFLEAAEVMQQDTSSRAHFLVGGKLQEKSYLAIEARKYFGVNDTPTNDIKGLFTNGLTREELEEYTKKFTKYKKSSGEGDVDGTSSGGFTYDSVLAVSKSKKRATLVPLHYFKSPAPKLELTNNYKPPKPF
ncbi:MULTISPECIES: hypothetical protein [Vibrio harveyi group]|uniref:hypothetical protein n=1 Tax=Vibrio harveyi group TaxID=717610 RepID=UPI00111CDB52|nr:hypothetical protein [Vibrio parahaemolyticus]TOF58967.1 hypothetical protein CGJ20_09780 [Vibrio parahaemolyticus]